MLEKIPSSLGRAMRRARAGAEGLVYNLLADIPAEITVTSSAFLDEGQLPARFTADGPGRSPPLAWRGAPAHTAELALLIEDPDAPMPHPLVHAIAWKLLGSEGSIGEGALCSAGHPSEGPPIGRNSYFSRGYLPPDPPSGHGPHRYAFELFALDVPTRFRSTPGRTAMIDLLTEHAIAKGMLIGTYVRL
jgi:Raf kinase inhibitor-like YbhB/YbcL family protein